MTSNEKKRNSMRWQARTEIASQADRSGIGGVLMPESNTPLPEHVRYQDPREIARGGMGRIYRATDGKFNREVAIKTLLEADVYDECTRQLFQTEARVTAGLEHPNIVPVHDAGRLADGRPFFSMKLVGGRSLAETMRGRGSEDENGTGERSRGGLVALLQIFLKACDALQFAHAQGIVHRDLKPDNIMIGDFGEVLVMDWGLALERGKPGPGGPDEEAPFRSRRSLEGMVVGTPSYMPPEQAEGDLERIDARSDIYALGAILYEILTGTPPFTGSDVRSILGRVVPGKLIPPTRRVPGVAVPRELEAVVLRAMAHDPDARYQSVSELQSEILAYLEDRTLEAASYGPLQRLDKWVRRNRKAVTVAALVTLLLGGFWGTSAWSRHREESRQFGKLMDEARRVLELPSEYVNRLTAHRPVVDPATGTERRDDRDAIERGQVFGAYFQAVGVLDRALQIRPEDQEARRLRRTMGLTLGQLAIQGRQTALARQVFIQLRFHGLSLTELKHYWNRIDGDEKALLAWRKQRLEFMLAEIGRESRLRSLGYETGWKNGITVLKSQFYVQGDAPVHHDPSRAWLDDFVFEASSFRDSQTDRILRSNLWRLFPESRELGRRGERRVWTQPERNRVVFICRVLGRIGLPECVQTIGTFLDEVRDESLAIEAGVSLCNTRNPEAAEYLERAERRLGPGSSVWVAVRPYTCRVPGFESHAGEPGEGNSPSSPDSRGEKPSPEDVESMIEPA